MQIGTNRSYALSISLTGKQEGWLNANSWINFSSYELPDISTLSSTTGSEPFRITSGEP
jgi:hypothetical protein